MMWHVPLSEVEFLQTRQFLFSTCSSPGWVKSGKSCRFFPDGRAGTDCRRALRSWPPHETAWFDRAHRDASNQPLASRWLPRGRAQSVPRDRNFAHRAHAVTVLHEHHAQARDPRLSMEPLIVAAFNTALVRSPATRLARFIPTHPLALLALRGARPCALQDKDRREPWAGGMLEAAYRRGRSRAADLRSCSGMERR